jgi:exo-1,4-beta-D-glucosaminidase
MRSCAFACLLSIGCGSAPPTAVPPPRCALAGAPGRLELPLASGWKIRSSADVAADDLTVATPSFATDDWFDATVPSTVMGTLVDDGVYSDVDVDLNLRSLPGMDYPVGAKFSQYEMADSNPFKTPWWYRTEFAVPSSAPGRRAWLRLQGLNYRANVFLNGRAIADETQVAGTYRQFELDVTDQLSSCGQNALAIKVRPQSLSDLGWNFVDWMPTPPDKLLGLWRPVSIVTTGPVRLRWPQVETHLMPPKAQSPSAQLIVRAELENATDAPVDATLSGALEGTSFSQVVTLAPRETREVELAPLTLAQPRLWWPAHMGAPELYVMSLWVDTDGQRSDEASVRFGVREATSELTSEGFRQFRINGEKVLIRGAGWTPDMMLRLVDGRIDSDLRYASDMNLNAIRLEGKIGFEPLYDLADELGLLVLAGWCCCDRWEEYDQWNDENRAVAAASLHDQARLLRSHPSALVWLNGSDGTPTPDVEKIYVDGLAAAHWPNPNIVSASDSTTALSGPSGVKMRGPYKWEPPSYWSTDTLYGGAFGFNTETSIGEAIPSIESVQKMLTPAHQWPIDDAWYFHLGTSGFGHMEPFVGPLASRYGALGSVEDFTDKAQLSSYEGVRAMYEAYGRNKYHATGVIQWMLENGWPSLIWQLYDFYQKPGGGYFAAKLANEPLHIQYGYDDNAVVVVNSYRQPQVSLNAEATVLDLASQVQFHQVQSISVAADAAVTAFTIPELSTLTTTYFVDLRLTDGSGEMVSRNFYWLSTVPDVLDYSQSELALTPVSSTADLTGLASLPLAPVTVQASVANGQALVALTNANAALAFFVRVEIDDAASGEELLPVHWSDNYVSLEPGETRQLSAPLSRTSSPLRVRVRGWNVPEVLSPLAP